MDGIRASWIELCLWSLVCGWGQSILNRALFVGGVRASWIEPCLWMGSEHPGWSLVCGWGQSILDRALFVGGVRAS